MALFTDTVTIYKKQEDGTYKRTVVSGVQWSGVISKTVMTGRVTADRSVSITFPEAVLSQVDLKEYTEEDAIFLGEIQEDVTAEKGHRLSDLMKAHSESGIIRTVNDNSNRSMLKNIKVVVY